MRNQLLNKTECDALRGIAIIGIFLHNYCHWLAPIVKENEYQYFQHNVDWLSQVLMSPWNNLLFFHLLSFFGHYGVPIFLFLSAYGLTLKYEGAYTERKESTKQEIPIWGFIKHHWLKLFQMMIVGFVAFIMIDAITPGQHHYDVVAIISQLGLFNNILPHPDKIIWPGPYWFFGLMLQLYVVYRLFIFRKHWSWVIGLILICMVIQLLCEPESEALNRWRYNFIGGMLPFGAGVLYARYAHSYSISTYTLVLFVSLIAIFGLSYNYLTWFFVPLFVCSAAISFIKLLGSIEKTLPLGKWSFSSVLSWIGSISAALFICHPITRKIFIPISKSGDYWTGLLLYIIASLCLACLFKALLRRMPKIK